jgi:hypothetical protein
MDLTGHRPRASPTVPARYTRCPPAHGFVQGNADRRKAKGLVAFYLLCAHLSLFCRLVLTGTVWLMTYIFV